MESISINFSLRVRKDHDHLDSPFTIGWISRLFSPKRPDILIDAIALLAEEFPGIRRHVSLEEENYRPA